jgi:hypothetical protein
VAARPLNDPATHLAAKEQSPPVYVPSIEREETAGAERELGAGRSVFGWETDSGKARSG